jgi:hypothetical protein
MKRKTKPTSTDVGANVLEELNGFIKKVTVLVGTPPALTGADIKRATKLRKGGEKVVTTIAALSDQFGLTFASHPTDAMVAQMNKANSLVALHRKLVAATKQVGDSIFLAQSESWKSAAVHYATLRKMAVTDGDVAKTLVPVTEFFARRPSTAVHSDGATSGGGGKKGSTTAQAATTPATDTVTPSKETTLPATAPVTTPTAATVTTAPASATTSS